MQRQAQLLQECFPFLLFKTLRAVDRDFRRHLPEFDIHYVCMLKLFDRLGRYLFGSSVEVRQDLLCLRVLLEWIETSGSKARLLCMHVPLLDDCVMRFWEDPATRLEGVLLLRDLARSLPEVERHLAWWHSLARGHASLDVGVATDRYVDYERQSRSWESLGPDRGVIPIEVLLCDYAIRIQDLGWATGMVSARRSPLPCLVFVVCVFLWALPQIIWQNSNAAFDQMC